MDAVSNDFGHTFTNFQISGAAHAHLGDSYATAQGKLLKLVWPMSVHPFLVSP